MKTAKEILQEQDWPTDDVVPFVSMYDKTTNCILTAMEAYHDQPPQPCGKMWEEVDVKELPTEEGTYMTKWKGVPAWTEKEFKGGQWQTRFDWTGLMTHWLRPLKKDKNG